MSDLLDTAIPATLTVGQPNDKALAASKVTFTDLANAIIISDQSTLEGAAKFLTDNKAEQKKLDEERRELVDPLNAVVKNLNSKYKPVMDALTSAESIIKQKISDYTTEQDRKQRQLQADADAKAEKERKRLEARADKAEESGNDIKAQALRDTASAAVATAPAPAIQKVAGIAVRKVWQAEVVDVAKVCKLIADGVLPATLIELKQAELNKIATQWQNTREFDGLRIMQKTGVAAGRR